MTLRFELSREQIRRRRRNNFLWLALAVLSVGVILGIALV